MASGVGNGFQDWRVADLTDPTLWKPNQDINFLFSKIAALWGSGSPQLQSSPTLATAYASSQTLASIKDTEFITKAVADQLYSKTATTATTVSTTRSTTTGLTPVQETALVAEVKQSLGGGVATYGLHAYRPGSSAVISGSLYGETDRTVVYQSRLIFTTPTWIYVVGCMVSTFANLPTDLGTNDTGFLFYATDRTQLYCWNGAAWAYRSGVMYGVLSALPAGLGTSNAGFLFYATDYYHLYYWNGTAWTFAEGNESSGMICPAVPGSLNPTAAWKPCDGSTVTIATSSGGTTAVATPPMTGGVFLRAVAAGSYTGTTAAPTATTLLTNVTVTTSVAPASAGISTTSGAVAAGTATTVIVSVTDPGHYHNAANTVVQPTFKAPTDTNGGLPSNLSVVWYIRI